MSRAALTLGLVLAVVTLMPQAAEARSVNCEIGYYSPGLDDEQFPTIHRLRAIDLPRRTDGYAPRCLVAEAVAALVKDRVARAARRHGNHFSFAEHAPRRVKPAGARWSGGTYRVRYREREGDVQVTATRGDRRVRFRII
jgi:hypothetical protein